MRILFFSDVHGNILSFRSFVSEITKIEYDYIVFGGDIFGYYYHQSEVIDILSKMKMNCLLGNHDKLFLDLLDGAVCEEDLIFSYGSSYRDIRSRISDNQICFLRSLKSRIELHTDSKRIVFVHGTLDNPLNGRIYPDTVINEPEMYDGIDVVFCGHTHHRMIKRINGTLIINPGSIGQQRDGKGCSFVLYDTQSEKYTFYTVDYNIRMLEQEVILNDFGVMRDRLIEVLYRKKDD